MKFIIGGRVIEINQLGDAIDQQFIGLHAAYYGNVALDWQQFEKVAIEFFNQNPNPNLSNNEYFNNFTVIWRNFLLSGNFDEAERILQLALSPALKWEAANPGQRIHKGTAFYYLGMTALQKGDLDKGYIFMHQAVEEDVLTSNQPIPDTPAFALASLNYAKANQTFRQWVLQQADFLELLLKSYQGTYGSTFSLDQFRDKFLLSPPNIQVAFLFAYSVARLMKLSQLPQYSVQSYFAGQLELNILFDVALVIDATVKVKNSTKWQFIDHAEFLLSATPSPLTNPQLRQINSDFNNNFDITTQSLLDGNYTHATIPALNRFQRDVSLVYGIRNHGAHDVSSSPVVWKRYLDIQQSLFNVMFYIAANLY